MRSPCNGRRLTSYNERSKGTLSLVIDLAALPRKKQMAVSSRPFVNLHPGEDIYRPVNAFKNAWQPYHRHTLEQRWTHFLARNGYAQDTENLVCREA
jgi:hypothetical protein